MNIYIYIYICIYMCINVYIYIYKPRKNESCHAYQSNQFWITIQLRFAHSSWRSFHTHTQFVTIISYAHTVLIHNSRILESWFTYISTHTYIYTYIWCVYSYKCNVSPVAHVVYIHIYVLHIRIYIYWCTYSYIYICVYVYISHLNHNSRLLESRLILHTCIYIYWCVYVCVYII